MATHESVSVFDPSIEAWTSYTQCMHYYFVANNVHDGTKKHSILLSTEDKLEMTLYDELVKAHYDPTPSAIMLCYKFNSRTRAEGKSVLTYVATLRDIYRLTLQVQRVTSSSR